MKKRLTDIIFLILALACSLALFSCSEQGHDHTLSDEFTITESATPEKDGSKTCVCTTCGEQVTVTIQKHAHEFDDEWTEKTPATDEAEGIEVRYCRICGGEDNRAIPKHEHTFSGGFTITKAATDNSSGRKSAVCDSCQKTVTVSVPLCEEHSYNNSWTVTKAPTMTAIGKEMNNCSECGYFTVRDIPTLEIVGLKMTAEPYTTAYFTGETFNPFGLEIAGVLSDGSEISVKLRDCEVESKRLTSADAYARVTYGELTLNVPITVSKYVPASVAKAFDCEDGAFIYVNGVCVGTSTAEGGEKEVLLKDSFFNCIILKGTSCDYKKGDEIAVYASVASDSYGKYLVYTEENGNGEKTLISEGNEISITDVGSTVIGDAMAERLFDGGIERYATVKFSGSFYIVNDGNNYLLHFNESATDKDGARLSSGKIIRISAQSASEALGEILSGAASSYPGIEVSASIAAIYLGSDSEGYDFIMIDGGAAKIDESYEEGYAYLTETARAYYYQLPYVDYDQYNARRNANPAPEDATSQHRIYLDCSSYVNAVYYNTFGVNILPYTLAEKSASTLNFTDYARENTASIDVVCYFDTAAFATEEERGDLLRSLYAELKVGDILVYRRAENGHTMIYVGDGKFLHCTGSSYEHVAGDPLSSYDKISETSIAYANASSIFENPESGMYLFKSTNVNFSILRPLNRGLAPTEQAKARMTIPSLSIEKSVSANAYASVFVGDELTYKITLKNNSASPLTDVRLDERVPEGAEFLFGSDGISHADGSIAWSGGVAAGETVTLTFTVRVSASAGALIESDEGRVNGLKLNKLINTVSKIERDELSAISELGYVMADEAEEYSDPILMINALYREMFGRDILDYESVAKALSDIISVKNKKVNDSSAVRDIVIADLSGGYQIRDSNRLDNKRMREVRIEYLSIGDVIIAQHTNAESIKIYTAYVYLGGNDFIAVTSDSGAARIAVYNLSEGNIVNNILVSLYSYEKYAFVRPSMQSAEE